MAVSIAATQHSKTTLRSSQRKAERDAQKSKRDTAIRREFARLAADMEQGYYVDAAGVQWPPQPFQIQAVLLRMGYAERRAVRGDYPAWWLGSEKMRKMVAYIVAVRRMQTDLDLSSKNAWAGPLIGLAVEDMERRLAESPEKISDRDLTELITKLTRLFVKPDGAAPGAPLPVGGTRFTAIFETVEQLPEGPAQENARRIYRRAIAGAQAALDAGQPEPA